MEFSGTGPIGIQHHILCFEGNLFSPTTSLSSLQLEFYLSLYFTLHPPYFESTTMFLLAYSIAIKCYIHATFVKPKIGKKRSTPFVCPHLAYTSQPILKWSQAEGQSTYVRALASTSSISYKKTVGKFMASTGICQSYLFCTCLESFRRVGSRTFQCLAIICRPPRGTVDVYVLVPVHEGLRFQAVGHRAVQEPHTWRIQ